MDLLGP